MAFELADLAERMQRERLHRRFPGETRGQIERRVDDWYRTRPGAEYGDAAGTPAPWPRRA